MLAVIFIVGMALGGLIVNFDIISRDRDAQIEARLSQQMTALENRITKRLDRMESQR